jgi:hypothetical protein
MKMSVSKQFSAFEDDKDLLPEDRRRLREHLESLTSSHSGERAVAPAVGTASRFEIWRSRLRYRLVPVATKAVVSAIFVISFAVAAWRTPQDWVASRNNRDVVWTLNGAQYEAPLVAGRTYPRMRSEADQSTIRDWVPRVGYAETTIPTEWLSVPQ